MTLSVSGVGHKIGPVTTKARQPKSMARKIRGRAAVNRLVVVRILPADPSWILIEPCALRQSLLSDGFWKKSELGPQRHLIPHSPSADRVVVRPAASRTPRTACP